MRANDAEQLSPKRALGWVLVSACSSTAAAMLFLLAHRVFSHRGEAPSLIEMIARSPADLFWVDHSGALLALVVVALLVALTQGSLRLIVSTQLALFPVAFINVLWVMGTLPTKLDFRILHLAFLANEVAWLSLACALTAAGLGFLQQRAASAAPLSSARPIKRTSANTSTSANTVRLWSRPPASHRAHCE